MGEEEVIKKNMVGNIINIINLVGDIMIMSVKRIKIEIIINL